MRYFSYNEYDPSHPDQGYVVTTNEHEIRRDYYPFWYERMCQKFGQEYVHSNYCFEDCLDDWVVVNWAWEVTE